MSKMPLYHRLIDRKIAIPTPVAKGSIFEASFTTLTEAAPNAVPFDVSETAAWLPVEQSKRVYDILAELPTCVPVYPVQYLEWDTDEGLDDGDRLHVAALLETHQAEYTGEFKLSASSGSHEETQTMYVQKGGFFSVLTVIYSPPSVGDRITLNPVVGAILFDREGNLIIENDEISIDMKQLAGMVFPDEQVNNYHEITVEMIIRSLFACSLLHCKNVGESIARLPRQQARERERKNLTPIIYKTLTVDAMRKPRTAAEADDLIAERHKKRVHLCRGHFQEYGPKYGKGLLFGRIEGRFWVPPTVKGSANVGEIRKDYRVKS